MDGSAEYYVEVCEIRGKVDIVAAKALHIAQKKKKKRQGQKVAWKNTQQRKEAAQSSSVCTVVAKAQGQACEGADMEMVEEYRAKNSRQRSDNPH